MSKILLDYDPLTGITESLDFSDDSVRVVREQSPTRAMESAKSLALNEDYTRQGIKRDQWHYARIPLLILEEMKTKHGADWNDKNDHKHKKFFRVLNTQYPAFKTTHWNHE
jgi:hypothetical protein